MFFLHSHIILFCTWLSDYCLSTYCTSDGAIISYSLVIDICWDTLTPHIPAVCNCWLAYSDTLSKTLHCMMSGQIHEQPFVQLLKTQDVPRRLIPSNVIANQSYRETQLFVSWVYLQIKRENIVLFFLQCINFLNLQNLIIFFCLLVNNIFRTLPVREPMENSGTSMKWLQHFAGSTMRRIQESVQACEIWLFMQTQQRKWCLSKPLKMSKKKLRCKGLGEFFERRDIETQREECKWNWDKIQQGHSWERNRQ